LEHLSFPGRAKLLCAARRRSNSLRFRLLGVPPAAAMAEATGVKPAAAGIVVSMETVNVVVAVLVLVLVSISVDVVVL
jgi:hypothetical protein